MVLNEGSQSNRIDVVFDTYQEKSIKNSERSVRGEETGHQFQSITSTQIVKQWRTFLSRCANKTSLVTFVVSEWRKAQYRSSCRIRFFMQQWITNAIESHPRAVLKSHFFNATKKKQMDVYFCMLPMLPEKGMKLLLSARRTQTFSS